ncbi:MAG: ABC transporter ATP-binding protein [Candidatus Hodarchaeales archaeon]|jgi:putative ABC transport system ATP-binding protein
MSDTEQPIIQTKDLWKIYLLGGKIEIPALQGVNLTIDSKDFCSILGVSGSGKSTLMHLIGFLDTPTRGELYFLGRELSGLTDAKRTAIRCREIGFVFQTFNLLPTLTALGNVEIVMRFAKVKKFLRKKRSHELLEIVGLKHRINHYPNELSGGERQRVAIARALANNPKLILADEPTGNLDSETGAEIMDFFTLINESGTTIFIVTHNHEIAKRTHTTYYMKDGTLSSSP